MLKNLVPTVLLLYYLEEGILDSFNVESFLIIIFICLADWLRSELLDLLIHLL